MHGHLIGDEVLTETAARVAGAVRPVTWPDLLREADGALHEAERAGRDCVRRGG